MSASPVIVKVPPVVATPGDGPGKALARDVVELERAAARKADGLGVSGRASSSVAVLSMVIVPMPVRPPERLSVPPWTSIVPPVCRTAAVTELLPETA